MTSYATPGVYVEEVSTVPASVAEVSTAIPAFIGYTEKSPVEGKAVRINSLLEYEAVFGKAYNSMFTLSAQFDAGSSKWDIASATRTEQDKDFVLYYCLDLYFKNGGGSCYIISTGDYDKTPTKKDFTDALKVVEQEDEPTLLLFPDALQLPSADYFSICSDALMQCSALGDRFAILDLHGEKADPVADFRNSLPANNLEYGAAYHPYLNTSLSYKYAEKDVQITKQGDSATKYLWNHSFGVTAGNGINVSYSTFSADIEPSVAINVEGQGGEAIAFSVVAGTLVIDINDTTKNTANDVVEAWTAWANGNGSAVGFDIQVVGAGDGEFEETEADLIAQTPVSADATVTLESLKLTETALYNQVKNSLVSQRVVLPPSAAIAGVYASVDRDRGVWKAPANVGLASVIGPVEKITDEAQSRLNVDATAGKSINAIRSFTGKGTLVWGARTLAGNDNEWRYISVRRLFNLIEESSRKATAFAVFEPNNTTTWLKVKAMIDSYLFSLWERGALAGATSEEAYFVNVGLGKTMTEQDVLEGRMVIEIGVSAVRPAEFVVLRFSHLLQEA